MRSGAIADRLALARLGRVQAHGLEDQRLQRRFIYRRGFLEVDGASLAAVKPRVEELLGIFQRRPVGKRESDRTLERLPNADDAVVGPDRHSGGIARLLPL